MKKLVIALLLAVSTSFVAADTFPNKTVKITIGFPAGSGPDSVLRVISEQLSKKWNTTVIVDNKPGGNGVIGLESYYKAPADGHNLYFGDNAVVVSYPILYNRKITDKLIPLVPVTQNGLMLFASPKVKDFRELTELIKQKPLFGSWGVGSAGHIVGLELTDLIGVSATHVPYREYSQWFTDTSNSELTFGFATPGSGNQLEKAGKLKFIAFAGSTRHPDYPNVPTILELTNKPVGSLSGWLAFFINKETPQDKTNQLEKDIREVLTTPEVKQFMANLVYKPWPISNREFEKYVASEINIYLQMVKKHNISSVN